MNDIERDLRELFHERASRIPVSGALPPAVLRRGRRRQAATATLTAAGGVALIAVAVTAVLSITHAPDRTPASTDGPPERVTTIGGVPITAPAGWTLVDSWPIANAISASSQVCTFTDEGVPVEDGGDAAAATSERECTSSAIDLPAGVPVLQLANFEIPLLETVCGLADAPPTTLPADGVAVYVGTFGEGMTTQTFIEACPGTRNISDGSVVTTFGVRDPETAVAGGTYAAVLVAGSAASPEDLAVGRRTMDELGGISVDPTVPVGGPGYVLAAGAVGPTTWRFEVGLDRLTDGPVRPSATLVLEDERSAGNETVKPTTGTDVESLSHWFSEDQVVTFGTAGRLVEGVDIVTGDGSTRAASFGWPAGLVTGLNTEPVEGSVWFAVTSERGDVVPVLADGPSPTAPTAGRVETRTEDGATVGTIEAFGRAIDIRVTDDSFAIEDAATSGSLFEGTTIQLDVDGGTLLVVQTPRDVPAVRVDVDGGADVEGAWMAVVDSMGRPIRLWVVPLAGSGSGLLSSDPTSLPHVVSWPDHETPQEGDVISSGTDGLSSWAIRWTGGCPVLEVVATSTDTDEGTSACITLWGGEAGSNAVGGIFGRDIATVSITGPAGMQLETLGEDPDPVYPQCGTTLDAEGWEGTGVCVVAFEAGRTVRFQPVTLEGNSLGRPIGLTVRNGALEMT
jgi:hypothetical protein